ncbi:MAG: NADH-quinone oxidoreductase subunit N [Phycisphaerales bacterium]
MIAERLSFLYPEIALFVTTCIVMVVGLSKNLGTRKLTSWIAGLGLLVTLFLSVATTPSSTHGACPMTGTVFTDAATPKSGQMLLPDMVPYAKALIALIGLMLLPLMSGTVDRLEEAAVSSGKRSYDALRMNRAEFYAFFLFSLTGLMLCASADDLIWLFLALELTSLPTYIMVAISTSRNQSREAGVKYFFLGAMGAAIFLFGFALIFGGTASTNLNQIAMHFHEHGINMIALAGILLSLIGFGFKIAAVPMHFYTPDVYQGAASQVSAFLAFVPKAAGFIAILLLCATVGWSYQLPSENVAATFGDTIQQNAWGTHLPNAVRLMLWVMAALTMTVGNVLAILQHSPKRMLAYSSIAHSGYMLVGVIAGPGDGSFAQNGVSAVLFYLASYGVMNLGAFAALASLERASKTKDGSGGLSEPREIDSMDDLRGLCSSHPVAGWTLVLCCLSLLGLPPLLGFFGKLPLFTSAINAGELPLVIVLGINSAIAAFYYLRLAFLPLTETPDTTDGVPTATPFQGRAFAGILSAAGVVILAIFAGGLMDRTTQAGRVSKPTDHAEQKEVTREQATETAPLLTAKP